MKKSFFTSLICDGGCIGGTLYLNDDSVTYQTNKLTVDKRYKNITFPLSQIKELTWKRVVFPIATFNLELSGTYKFIIYNKSRFVKWFDSVKK